MSAQGLVLILVFIAVARDVSFLEGYWCLLSFLTLCVAVQGIFMSLTGHSAY
jgi:hypothetical protein